MDRGTQLYEKLGHVILTDSFLYQANSRVGKINFEVRFLHFHIGPVNFLVAHIGLRLYS